MYILGFNCYAFNSAACILKNGKLIASAQEERFNRKKIYGGFPLNAINYCFSEAGITADDLDYVGFHWRPFHQIHRRAALILRYLPYASYLYNSHAFKWFDILNVKSEFNKRIVSPTRKKSSYSFIRVKHHICHSASSFLLSPYDKAAILTLDGTGEAASTMMGFGEDNHIRILKEIFYPDSLGYLFVALTHYLGFLPESDEYKLMSLASYGEDRFYEDFKKIIVLKPEGGYTIDTNYFNYQKGIRNPWVSEKFTKNFGPIRNPEEPIEQRHKDIARALQKRLEDAALHMARHLYKITGSRNLCLAGGVALNSVMNGRLLRESPFENIFVQPAANDAGTCIGSALYIYNSILGNHRQYIFRDAYLGPSYPDVSYRKALDEKGLGYEYLTDEKLLQMTAELLSEGKIAGWFQGRMEMGPRALGNRSILADPRNPAMKEILNSKVKHREGFRPFAPSVLLESAREYFECDIHSPFMLFVFNVRPEKRSVIPAVTHVDGTARVQTVDVQENPLFWKLIKEFEKTTGIPILLNTSFNVMGEPIVCSPGDAVECFLKTQIDFLVMGNYIALRK